MGVQKQTCISGIAFTLNNQVYEFRIPHSPPVQTFFPNCPNLSLIHHRTEYPSNKPLISEGKGGKKRGIGEPPCPTVGNTHSIFYK